MNIVLFWSSSKKVDETYDEWINRKIELSYFHELSLKSHFRVNNKVFLCSYQKFGSRIKIPSEVVLINANDHFSSIEAYRALDIGHSIAHIADLVRLSVAMKCNGVVMDMDTVMINPFPAIECFTSTLFARKSGAFAVPFNERNSFKYVQDWNGQALSNFPTKVHQSISQDIQDICSKIKLNLNKKPPKTSKFWNFVMWEMREIANRNPHVRVMKPIECAPVPGWKTNGGCYSLDNPHIFTGDKILFGNEIPSIKEIFEKTFAIQHYFESTFKSNPLVQETFFRKIKSGSLLDLEIKLINGSNDLMSKFD